MGDDIIERSTEQDVLKKQKEIIKENVGEKLEQND